MTAAVATAESRPRFLTRRQYAKELQVNERTVDRLIRAGEINAVRVGNSVRIPVEELDRGAGTRPNR